MLKIIENLPEHVLGITAGGKVTKTDMEQVLLPALDAIAGRTGQLNYLLVLETPVQNFTASAWWQDMIAGLKHFTDWRRIAVVTGQKPVAMFTDLFELGVPGESKGFEPAQLEEAKTWVAGTPRDSRIGRTLLGAGLIFAGISHLTFLREDFRAQVPNWVPLKKDGTVFWSGIAEIALGSALVWAPEKAAPMVGKVAAGFFTAVFPGNIAQYTHHRSAFGLNSDQKRLSRLFFQPLLVLWALKSTIK